MIVRNHRKGPDADIGAGLELDTTRYDAYATRVRLLLRYKVGDNVTGWAVGLAASF